MSIARIALFLLLASLTAIGQSSYPGTGEDLLLRTSINFASLTTNPTPSYAAGDYITVNLQSPGATLNFLSLSVIVTIGSDFLATNPVPLVHFPSSLGTIGGLYGNPTGPFPTESIWGSGLVALGVSALLPPNGGTTFTFQAPPSVSTFDILLQGIVLGPTTANGFFASTDGIVLQPIVIVP